MSGETVPTRKLELVERAAEDEPVPVDADGTDRRSIDYGPLAQRLGYVLRRAQMAVFQDVIAAFAEHDIRPGQYSILTIIECNPGLSQTEVAATLGIKKPNFVAMIDRLQARGLVHRAAAPNDRRSHALFLTDAGKRLMRKLHRIAAQHEKRVADRVGDADYRRMFAQLWAIAGINEGRPTEGT